MRIDWHVTLTLGLQKNHVPLKIELKHWILAVIRPIQLNKRLQPRLNFEGAERR